jgi:hypothetical protein
MFSHTGFRPLWPVIFFLPGFFLGVAYLLAAIVQSRLRLTTTKRAGQTRLARHHWRTGAGLVILGLAFLAASHVVLADPHESQGCEVADAGKAKLLADQLYDKGEYQRAGVCYDAAGDQLHAQRAFLKAVGPNSEIAAHDLRKELNTAKALANKVQQAFRSDH